MCLHVVFFLCCVQMLIVTMSHNYNNQSPRVVAAFSWTHENSQGIFHLKRSCVDAQHIKKKQKTYGPCRFSVSFQNVRKRVTGLSDIIISSCSPCLDWVHTVYRNKWLWLLVMSRAKSPHLSWLTCSLLDMNWNGFIHGNHKKGRQNSSAMLSKECSLIVYYTSMATWHP